MVFVLQGAAEMAQMEHIINVYASKAAKGSIAEFLGYCEVRADQANYKLTEGLWLVSEPIAVAVAAMTVAVGAMAVADDSKSIRQAR